MTLFGSDTSPYVRRIRVWCDLNNIELPYQHLDIFSSEGRKILTEHNPAGKIPFLVDDEQVIYDSGVIFEYLNEKHGLTALSWDERNLLTAIDAANDSAVELVLSMRSGLDIDQDVMFFNLQKARITRILKHLEAECEAQRFEHDYLQVSVYCLVDWLAFRGVGDLALCPKLVEFCQRFADKDIIALTDPRKA